MVHWQVKPFGLGYGLFPALMDRLAEIDKRWGFLASFLVMSRWTGAGLVLGAAAIVSKMGYKLLFVGKLAYFSSLAIYHDGTSRLWACTFLFCTNLITAVVAVHGPRARAHGPGWAGFFLQAHAMSPWAHAISLCGLRLGQI